MNVTQRNLQAHGYLAQDFCVCSSIGMPFTSCIGTEMGDNQIAVGRSLIDIGKHSLLHFALKNLPVIGPGFEVLVGAMTDRSIRRIALQFERLEAVVAENIEKANLEYIATEEFESLFKRAINGMAREHQREKLDAFGNLLAHSIIEKATFDRDANMLSILEQLTIPQLSCLQVMRSRKDGKPRDRLRSNSDYWEPATIAERIGLPAKRPHVGSAGSPEVDEVRALLDQLVSLGLAESQTDLSLQMGNQNKIGRPSRYTLSLYGIDFVDRIGDIAK